MKPYPLAPLNHFTVPFSFTNYSFRLYPIRILFTVNGSPSYGDEERMTEITTLAFRSNAHLISTRETVFAPGSFDILQ